LREGARPRPPSHPPLLLALPRPVGARGGRANRRASSPEICLLPVRAPINFPRAWCISGCAGATRRRRRAVAQRALHGLRTAEQVATVRARPAAARPASRPGLLPVTRRASPANSRRLNRGAAPTATPSRTHLQARHRLHSNRRRAPVAPAPGAARHPARPAAQLRQHRPPPHRMATSEATVTLVSSEGSKLTVPKKVAEVSELVKSMTEDGALCGGGGGDGGRWHRGASVADAGARARRRRRRRRRRVRALPDRSPRGRSWRATRESRRRAAGRRGGEPALLCSSVDGAPTSPPAARLLLLSPAPAPHSTRRRHRGGAAGGRQDQHAQQGGRVLQALRGQQDARHREGARAGAGRGWVRAHRRARAHKRRAWWRPKCRRFCLCGVITSTPAPSRHRRPLLLQPLRSSNLADVVPQWYADFVNVPQVRGAESRAEQGPRGGGGGRHDAASPTAREQHSPAARMSARAPLGSSPASPPSRRPPLCLSPSLIRCRRRCLS
jgi:hypothetical protein